MSDAGEIEFQVAGSESTVTEYTPQDPDEIRRAWVFSYMVNSEIDGDILIRAMDSITNWIKDGTVPRASRKSALTVVKE